MKGRKMSSCDDFEARIADLPDLRDAARFDLERHAETCRSCRAKLLEYRALMATLRSLEAPRHVDGERLTRFAIHRAAPTEPDYDQTRLSVVEIEEIEGHVDECPSCRLAVDSIIEQYHEVDLFLAEAGIPSVAITKPSLRVSARNEIARAWSLLVSIPSYRTAGVALGCLLLVLSWTGPWLRDPYHQQAFVKATKITFQTRGNKTLSEAISCMNEGRYREALTLIEPYIASEPDAPLLDYAHYLAGFAWVSEAKTEVFGRVLDYSEARLDRGIEHLQLATESSRNGIREDAFWLLGKARLTEQDPDRALEAFREVERLDGSRAAEARQLVQAVQKIQGR